MEFCKASIYNSNKPPQINLTKDVTKNDKILLENTEEDLSKWKSTPQINLLNHSVTFKLTEGHFIEVKKTYYQMYKSEQHPRILNIILKEK